MWFLDLPFVCYCEQYRTPEKVDLFPSSGGKVVSDGVPPFPNNPCSDHGYFESEEPV
jgi:hypothetical protein